jgi:glutamyl-tRNA reductase
LDNVYLYNIDDLQAIAGDYLRQRREEIARCEAIIAEKAGAMMRGRGRARPAPRCPDLGKASA